MENKEMRNDIPMELEDDLLEEITGGATLWFATTAMGSRSNVGSCTQNLDNQPGSGGFRIDRNPVETSIRTATVDTPLGTVRTPVGTVDTSVVTIGTPAGTASMVISQRAEAMITAAKELG